MRISHLAIAICAAGAMLCAQPRPPRGQPKPAATNDSGPVTPPAGTKIEPALMAPLQEGAQMGVSPHGIHVATLSNSGSRVVIIYDGVAGPKFDTILPQNGPLGVVFSPDGNRYAYCGQVGNEWVVMVDGKELVRGSVPATGRVSPYSCTLGFTSNSKHLYFTSVQDATNPSTAWRFVFDGKPGPFGAPSDLREYAFSPDGNHFAYIWAEPVPRSTRRQLFIDNQPAPYNAGEPQWSADSEHLFTKRTVPVPNSRSGSAREVLYDGKPIMRADFVMLFIPPAGNMFIAQVRREGAPQVDFLVVGGKLVPGSEIPSPGNISNITFSPDGKHYAAIYRNANSRQWVFCDGKKGQEYNSIGGPGGLPGIVAFTADSSKVFFQASTGSSSQTFFTYGSEESDPLLYFTETVVAPAGPHVGTEGAGQVSIDGKALKLSSNPQTSSAGGLSFSPDGAHYAFFLRDRGANTLFLDGVAQANSPINQGPMSNITTRPYVFSPDSKHIAYFCRPNNPAAANDNYLCLDDKSVRLGTQAYYSNLTFSGDSNHLFWTQNGPQTIVRIFADGKPVVEAFYVFAAGFNKETWQIGPDGNLLALVQDETSLKRLAVTPAPTSSLAALLGR